MATTEKRSVLVVGGGMVGWSCAWQLAKRGRPVTVVDRPCPQAAYKVAAGLLIPVGGKLSPSHLELKVAAAECFEPFVRQLESETGMSCGYQASGTLTVALEPGAFNAITGMVGCLKGLGVVTEVLDRRQCRELEPCLGPEVGAGYLAADHSVDPQAMVRALRAACEARGVSAREGSVVRVSPSEVKLADGTALQAHQVLVTAGAWLQELLPVKVYPVKGETLEVSAPLLGLSRNLCVQKLSLYLAFRGGGHYVLGATEEEAGFDPQPVGADSLKEKAIRVLPELAKAEFGTSRVGFRPKVGDGLPVMGRLDGVYVAGAHYRNGVLLAPITSELMAELLDTGEVPELMRPLDPARDTRKKSWKA